eukprot:TRINITY_DN382_c0_g1_i1.p1 TRINITY_DN382_c0_g1~~TRINITY_DN382_c0_g1_i1.p1  ORF type:complete len:619 (+),score=175.55 TRINITY_DN382_c0_g1_i1:25-1857(+)
MAQANAPTGGDQPQGGGGGGGRGWLRLLFFAAVYYFLFRGGGGGGDGKVPEVPVVTTTGEVINAPVGVDKYLPYFLTGTHMDLYLYLSPSESELEPNSPPVWTKKDFVFGSWLDEDIEDILLTFPTPSVLKNNGTYYAHFRAYSAKANVDEAKPFLSSSHQLNKFVKTDLAKFAKKNLVSGEVDDSWLEREKWEEEMKAKGITDATTVKVLSRWKGNVTINLVQDFTAFKPGQIPDPLLKKFKFVDGKYLPIVFFNDFWLLNEDLIVLNETVEDLSLEIHFAPMSFFKWSLFAQMDESFSMQKTMFGSEEGETEDFKRLLLDNNPYVLLLTMIISIAHTVLDTLAFKNDIQFWREKKSMEGMSVRTIYVNIITNVIIFFYLVDNDTSWMIMFSIGVGVLIECWKITRAAKVTMGKWNGIPYPIVTDKDDYVSSTKKHDLDAMKYLYWACYPLVGCYAIYAVLYESHKSWYSFVIGTLAGCVYTFGFIAMVPQLLINYRLKSVAHLPWRVFVYKAISTFIDDIFAFLIRMPTLHRLRVFRDDIVFFIYLYQRYIYPVDMKRIEIGADFADVSVAEIEQAKFEMEQKKLKQEGKEPTVAKVEKEANGKVKKE